MSGFITINKQKIPWSFVGKVRKALGGDADRTMDCFYKARECPPPDGVIRYVAAGFKPDAQGVRYSTLPSKEREERGMRAVRAWWASLRQPSTRPRSMGEIFAEILGK